ncbi:MAG: Phosphoglycerate mutase [Myxococcales bacterium]|nr:Phosphoglycerate mutase [Myxococcales bacterium]
MGSTEILLVRHGQSEGNENGRFGGHGPTPLTALGRRQAEATGAAIAAEGTVAAIFASDLVRAVQTAQPLVAATGVAMQTTPALRERSVGVFTGMTFAEAEEQHPEHFAAMMRREPDACPPEGETPRACLVRAGDFLEAAIAAHASGGGGRVVVVSHAFTLNLLVRRVLGLEESGTVFFRTDNCGVHRLRRSEAGFWNVEALNDRRHLGGVK